MLVRCLLVIDLFGYCFLPIYGSCSPALSLFWEFFPLVPGSHQIQFIYVFCFLGRTPLFRFGVVPSNIWDFFKFWASKNGYTESKGKFLRPKQSEQIICFHLIFFHHFVEVPAFVVSLNLQN